MNAINRPVLLLPPARTGAGHGRLGRLLLLSLGLHLILFLGLLALWPHEAPQPLQAGGEGMVVRLAPVVARPDDASGLQQPDPAPAATTTTRETATPPLTATAETAITEPYPAQPIAHPAQPVPQALSEAPTTAATDSVGDESATRDDETAQVADSALRSAMKLQMQDELARHFLYPPLARKRGWQGEVLLAFRLESDGSILDARIARSSGYGMLDRAALDSLGRVGRLHHPPPRGIAMELPVIYRLEG